MRSFRSIHKERSHTQLGIAIVATNPGMKYHINGGRGFEDVVKVLLHLIGVEQNFKFHSSSIVMLCQERYHD